MKYSSKSRTDWVCKSCGNVFRNPKDVEAEEYEKNMAYGLDFLSGSLILYVVGNLFRDNEVRFLGIPGGVYVALGVLGAIIGLLALSILVLVRMIDSMPEDMEDAETVLYLMPGVKKTAGFAVCVSGAVLISGIIFAVSEIRFFWIPFWIYILLGLIGVVVCLILGFFLYFIVKEDK